MESYNKWGEHISMWNEINSFDFRACHTAHVPLRKIMLHSFQFELNCLIIHKRMNYKRDHIHIINTVYMQENIHLHVNIDKNA